MRRGGPLKRSAPLARGDVQLQRTPLKPGRRKWRKTLTDATKREVMQRSRGRCIVCGSKRMLQRHHVLPVQRWPEYETTVENMVIVCAGCHDEHERARRRIPLAALPQSVRTWVVTRGGREESYLYRTYAR